MVFRSRYSDAGDHKNYGVTFFATSWHHLYAECLNLLTAKIFDKTEMMLWRRVWRASGQTVVIDAFLQCHLADVTNKSCLRRNRLH